MAEKTARAFSEIHGRVVVRLPDGTDEVVTFVDGQAEVSPAAAAILAHLGSLPSAKRGEYRVVMPAKAEPAPPPVEEEAKEAASATEPPSEETPPPARKAKPSRAKKAPAPVEDKPEE